MDSPGPDLQKRTDLAARLSEIARLLNVPVETFDPPADQPSQRVGALAPDDLGTLVAVYLALGPEDRALVLAMARRLGDLHS